MNDKSPSPSALVIMIAGAVVLAGSFLAFYQAPSFHYGGISVGGGSRNAWSSDLFFPVTILPVLLGVVMAVQVALTTFADVSLPERVLGLTWDQLHLAFGAQATIMMLAFLVQDRSGLSIGIGFWLMLLASIGLLVGAVMRQREAAPA